MIFVCIHIIIIIIMIIVILYYPYVERRPIVVNFLLRFFFYYHIILLCGIPLVCMQHYLLHPYLQHSQRHYYCYYLSHSIIFPLSCLLNTNRLLMMKYTQQCLQYFICSFNLLIILELTRQCSRNLSSLVNFV